MSSHRALPKIVKVLRYGWPFAFAIAFTVAFITPYCGFLFRCGCTQLWMGAFQYCNIRNVDGPHCPFCSHGTSHFLLYAGSPIVVMQFATLILTLRRGSSAISGLLVPLGAFLAAGALVAWVFSVHDGYHLW